MLDPCEKVCTTVGKNREYKLQGWLLAWQSHWAHGKFKMANHGWDNAVLSYAYPIHVSANKVNYSDVDAQVISCHSYLVIFHLFDEQQLTVIYISGLIFEPA